MLRLRKVRNGMPDQIVQCMQPLRKNIVILMAFHKTDQIMTETKPTKNVGMISASQIANNHNERNILKLLYMRNSTESKGLLNDGPVGAARPFRALYGRTFEQENTFGHGKCYLSNTIRPSHHLTDMSNNISTPSHRTTFARKVTKNIPRKYHTSLYCMHINWRWKC